MAETTALERAQRAWTYDREVILQEIRELAQRLEAAHTPGMVVRKRLRCWMHELTRIFNWHPTRQLPDFSNLAFEVARLVHHADEEMSLEVALGLARPFFVGVLTIQRHAIGTLGELNTQEEITAYEGARAKLRACVRAANRVTSNFSQQLGIPLLERSEGGRGAEIAKLYSCLPNGQPGDYLGCVTYGGILYLLEAASGLAIDMSPADASPREPTMRTHLVRATEPLVIQIFGHVGTQAGTYRPDRDNEWTMRVSGHTHKI